MLICIDKFFFKRNESGDILSFGDFMLSKITQGFSQKIPQRLRENWLE